jgi:hypothetical protein
VPTGGRLLLPLIHPSRRPDFAHDARGPRSPARLDAIDIKGPSREIGGPFRGVSAEFERSLIRERTQAGLAAARPRWSHGRPSTETLTDDDIEAAKAMLANPDIGVTQIAHRLGVSPATLYRYIPAARTARIPPAVENEWLKPTLSGHSHRISGRGSDQRWSEPSANYAKILEFRVKVAASISPCHVV